MTGILEALHGITDEAQDKLIELRKGIAEHPPPCEQDPDLWFEPGVDNQRIAAGYCVKNCQIRAACLAYAIEAREKNGVWGGLTQAELKKIYRANKSSMEEQRATGVQARATGDHRGCSEKQAS